MALNPVQYPLVNGFIFSWASVEAGVVNVAGGLVFVPFGGNPFLGLKSIDYKPTIKRTVMYGQGMRPRGRTAGQASFEGSFEMYMAPYYSFIQTLGDGYGLTSFDIRVAHNEPTGAGVVTDLLQGCVIDDDSLTLTEGDAGSVIKVTLNIVGDIKRNGLSIAPKALQR